MNKTFKVVCIEANNSTFLEIGTVYEANEVHLNYAVYNICTADCCGDENFGYKREYFLRLPTEPKTCADMSMEEYLAMVCLANIDSSLVEYFGVDNTYINSTGRIDSKGGRKLLYRVKPAKSARDIEVERIEKEMRKLADALSAIKRE